jgi:hypothetical protein
MTKLYAQRKDVFDIDKVTVVGSPTITSDGVASGFSTTNYLQIPMPNLAQYNTWEIICKFKMNTVPETGFVFTYASSKANQVVTQSVYNKNLGIAIGNSTGTAWQVVESTAHGTTIIEPNKTYWSKIKFTGTSYDLMLSTDGVNYNLEYSYASTQNVSYDSSYNFNFGIARNPSVDVLNGNIMMADFTIIGDGKLVYSPTKPVYSLERRKEGFDLSKFTVVGSPTITEYGVASGFSSSNYVGTIPLSNLINKSWEITSPIVTNVNSQNYGINACQLAQRGYGADGGIYFVGTNKSIMFKINTPSDDTPSVRSNNRISIHKTLDTIPERIQLKFSFNYTTGTYTGFYNIFDGKGWQIAGSITPTTIEKQLYDIVYNSSNDIKVGAFDDAKQLEVNLDLTQFSITVDGKEVFTGAKEKYYAMRGGM